MREAAKAAARSLATILVVPALLSYWVRRRFIGADRALHNSSQALAIVPGIFGQYVRRAFLARVLSRCHSTATIEFGTLFSQVGAEIDENVYVGPRCHLGLVHLERDVLLAAGVHVPSGPQTHGTSDLGQPIRTQQGSPQLVRIGAGAWIGSAAIVMADVGRGTVVGAGAVVTKPLPECVIAAGVPARPIRHRDGSNSLT